MCGFAGIAAARPRVERSTLEAMNAALRHRGPDSEGVWLAADGRVGLAHRRLAIIDLSPAAGQPMVSPDGRWFSFSRRYGETWPTTTDAEIYWMDASIIEELRED